jgi:hypothetical protein
VSGPLLGGDRHQLGEYLRELADLMGLRDWHLILADGPPESEPTEGHRVQGECTVSYGRKSATIAVSDDWAGEDPDELRRVLVHELIHCHQEPVQWAFNNAANRLGFEAGSVAREAFTDAFEIATDGIAVPWAETLPLPGKAKEEGDEHA